MDYHLTKADCELSQLPFTAWEIVWTWQASGEDQVLEQLTFETISITAVRIREGESAVGIDATDSRGRNFRASADMYYPSKAAALLSAQAMIEDFLKEAQQALAQQALLMASYAQVLGTLKGMKP